jgi:AraC-like DNA-binding protein
MPAVLLHGVVTRRFTVMLRGEGSVFGVKFRPGGFGAFTGVDVGALADRVEPLSTVFGSDAEDLLDQMLGANADAERVALLNRFLLQRVPGPDPRYARLLDVVCTMLTDRSITSVEQVTERFGISPRTLQRLFRRYVGVGPKWVLQRFRLHDAAALIDAGGAPDLATLAHSLGWFDQAHFSRDFAAAVGETPRAYAARAAAARR